MELYQYIFVLAIFINLYENFKNKKRSFAGNVGVKEALVSNIGKNCNVKYYDRLFNKTCHGKVVDVNNRAVELLSNDRVRIINIDYIYSIIVL